MYRAEITLQRVNPNPPPARTKGIGMATYSAKNFALDVLIGLALLVVGLMPAVLLQHFLSSGGPLIAAIGVVYFFASFLRARIGGNPLLQGIGIALGVCVPVLLVVTLLFRLVLPMLLTLSFLLMLICICGAFASSLWTLKQRPAAAAITCCIALFGFVTWHYGVPRLITSAVFKQIDKPAPNFTLTRLDGTPVTLASLKGHVVLLDFWATWCAPCQAEMPALLTVYKQFATNADFIYIAVDTGWEGDTDDKVRSFVTKKHFPFPVAFDPNHLASSLKISSIPAQILIDRQGHIRQLVNTNPGDDAELKSRLTSGIEALLKQ
jgi:peroxiredoxin